MDKTELLAEIKEEARMPDTSDYSDADILAQATQAIWSELQSPLLLGLGAARALRVPGVGGHDVGLLGAVLVQGAALALG